MKKSIKSQIGIALQARINALEEDLKTADSMNNDYIVRVLAETKEAKEWLIQQEVT